MVKFSKFKKWYIVIPILLILLFSISFEDSEESPTTVESKQETTVVTTTTTEAVHDLDKLQELYLNIKPSMSYKKVIKLISSYGLKYSEESYNGGRDIQVAFTDNNTEQEYADIDGDYIEICFEYPKNKNSINDAIDKYSLGTVAYIPYDSDIELIEHITGNYWGYTDKGNYITKLGSKVDVPKTMTKKQQLDYYFKNK